MNIIKFKDIIAEGHIAAEDQFFNESLRGKYAHWVHCRYIVSMDDVPDIYQIIEFEKNIDSLINSETPYIDLGDDENHEYTHWIATESYIDWTITNKANAIGQYIRSNEFVPKDITKEELKEFRTWLAEQIMTINPDLSDNEFHVLSYYAQEMEDNTIDWLKVFGQQTVSVNNEFSESSCGCTGNSNISSLYSNTASICDPISIYKTNIYQMMVAMFSNIEFWSKLNELDVDFLDRVIVYLNGIIDADFPLVTENNPLLDVYSYSCGCLGDVNFAQAQAQEILRNLIIAFNMIKGENVAGNKNSIVKNLSVWASKLYEAMRWS